MSDTSSTRLTGAHLDLAAAMVIVGSSAAAGKLVIAELPVFLAMGIRFLIAAAAAMAVLKWRGGALLPRLTRRSWLVFLAQAFCGVLVFNALLLLGLRHTSAAHAGLITATTPACMGIMAWAFLKERPTTRTLLGILAAVAGVGVLNLAELGPGSMDNTLSENGNPLFGNLLVVGAVVGESAFLLLRKGIREPVSALGAATAVSIAGLVLFLPGALIQAVDFDFSAVSGPVWGVLVYYGLCVSVLAYLFWFRGIVRVSGQTAGVFTGVMPVSALLFSALVLAESLGWEHLVGLVLVLAAIVLSSLKPAQPGQARAMSSREPASRSR
jgi:drug/metabolite transporter (DMT)-like permease